MTTPKGTCPKCKQQTLEHMPIHQVESWGDNGPGAKHSIWCNREECDFAKEL